MPASEPEPSSPPRLRVVRSRKPRRRQAGNYYLRLALLMIGGVTVAYALFAFLIKAVHPYKLGYEEAQKIAVMNTQLAQQKADNSALRKRVAYLNTAEGAEVEARRSGWQKPGETVYLISKPQPSPPAPNNGGF